MSVQAESLDPGAGRSKNIFERLLGVFAEVRAGEGLTTVLLILDVFLLLAAYYILKTVREPLIAVGGVFGLGGPELKTYASAGQAFLLLGVVPAYGALASKVNRIRLLNTTGFIFVGCLVLFYVLADFDIPLGLIFFVWLGIFNVLVIAQFWSYANDLYSKEQGKRLFPIIAVGGSLGAILGPRIAKLGKGFPFELMLVAAGILLLCLLLYNAVNRIEARRIRAPHDEPQTVSGQAVRDVADQPLGKEGGFELVMRDRYLLFIALMLLVANLVNTTGEYILTETVRGHAVEQIPDSAFPQLVGAARQEAIEAARGEIIQDFYGGFYGIVNLVSALIQALVVSRIFKYLGVRTALYFLPVIALGGYALMGMISGLAFLRVAKTAENSTDYSLQNTVRQALFLPTSREAKYKAKAAIDTFFWRFGDAAAAGLVYLGIHQLGFATKNFAATNVVLALFWLGIVAAIARRHKVLVPDDRQVPVKA